MNNTSKNKLLTWLVVLLLVANAVTIAFFWLNKKPTPPQPKGSPKDFLVQELKLDAAQQEQLETLVKEHRQAVEQLREKVKQAKDSLFVFIKQNNTTDSIKQSAAAAVSRVTEQIDLLTLDHFQKVRAICNAEQQKKFDDIIREVIAMMAQPRPPGGPNHPMPPPPDGPPH